MKIKDTLYFDHQATTPVDKRVLEAMTPYFDELFGNPHSADHAMGWEAAQAVEASASKVANLIGGEGSEIVFTSGATEANNLALLGLARHSIRGNRRRILISVIEHKSILEAAYVLQKQFGFEVESIPVDRDGIVMVHSLERILTEDVLVVSIGLVNNEIGTIQPIRDIYELCSESGTILHCDGAQAPCAIDLKNISNFVDLLSLSAHKMYGPKGVGALFIRHDIQGRIEPIIYGGGQQHNLRSGTIPVALCVGMGVASDLLYSPGSTKERDRLKQHRDRFIECLTRLRWPIHLNGPQCLNRHPGNANLRFEGFSAHEILGALQPHLAASTGSACTTGVPEVSHVLRAIGLSESEAQASIRFSLGRLTTNQDVDEAVDLIDNTLSRLAHIGTVRSN